MPTLQKKGLTFPQGPGLAETIASASKLRNHYLSYVASLQKDFGDFVQVRIPQRIYFLFHPDDIKHVLKNHHSKYTKSEFFKELSPLLGQGLLTSEGEYWKNQRSLMAPQFTQQALKNFIPLIVEATKKLMRVWEDSVKNREIRNIHADFTQLTLEIASHSLFGTNVSEESKKIHDALAIASDRAVERMLSIIKWPLIVPTLKNRQYKKAIQTLDEIVLKIISATPNDASSHANLLSRLKSSMNREGGQKQLRDEVMTLLLAGYDTTSNLLSWSWYCLSKHPETFRKLHSEVSSLNMKNLNLDNLQALHWTKAVLNESMRLFPPAPIISRSAVDDDEVGGFFVPKGTILEISPWITHRHPHFWENPDTFLPERFLNSQDRERHPFQYFPFGGGPRECIGKNFAMLEALIVLTMTASQFRFELSPHHEVIPHPLVTLRPKFGLWGHLLSS